MTKKFLALTIMGVAFTGTAFASNVATSSTDSNLATSKPRVEIEVPNKIDTPPSEAHKIKSDVESDAKKMDNGIKSDVRKIDSDVKGDMHKMDSGLKNDGKKMKTDIKKIEKKHRGYENK